MYNMEMWAAKNKKRKNRSSDSDDESDMPSPLVFNMPSRSHTNVYSSVNHVYFNNDITSDSAFSLNKQLRSVDTNLKFVAAQVDLDDPIPIYLHLKTDGGCVHSALSIVDCMNSLTSPVYTVIDGFVASAGTIISVAGAKRFIQPNAYMLIHQLRSGVWGKMTDIDEEYSNLKKVSAHIIDHYAEHTKLSKAQLEKFLKKEVHLDAEESIGKGLVDSIYQRKM